MKQTRLLKILVAGAMCAVAIDVALAGFPVGAPGVGAGKWVNPSQTLPQQLPQAMQQQQTTGTRAKAATMSTTTGTIATYDPGSDHFMFRPSPKAAPVPYYQTKDTVIVDLQGRTVNQSEIRPGIGATMYYTPSGDRMIVRKIVLGQPTTGYEKKATRTKKKKLPASS